MNGARQRAYFSFGTPLAAGWKRLYAALAASCLLHAALFFLPYSGTSTEPPPPAARTTHKGAAAGLEVRLREVSAAARPAPNRTRGSDRLPLAAPTYYSTDQLTKRPQPTSDPDLRVPRKVARLVNGKVVLNLWIDELGHVKTSEVESSNLPEAVSEIAATAFGNVRFEPGEIKGRRVPVFMRIEVTYVDGRPPRP